MATPRSLAVRSFLLQLIVADLLSSMFDPPRAHIAATIREAGNLGIKVKMLTGDAVAIAIETCKQLGVGTKVYDSQKLISGGGMSGSTMCARFSLFVFCSHVNSHDFVEAANGFGEVFPEYKYQVSFQPSAIAII